MEIQKMSRLKAIMSAGILVASGALSSNSPSTDNEMPVPQEKHTLHTLTKRTAQKVYHRFEEIPAISDEDARLYKKSEYTYIINAEHYQQTGNIELKRVLTDEITKASALGLIFRSECGTYIPQENEDQMTCYDVDMKLINPTGTYKGPSQMDDNAIASFARYLTANPDTRKYILPLITFKPNNKLKKELAKEMAEQNIDNDKMLDFALSKLEKLYFNENNKLLPMDDRNTLIHHPLFKSILFDSNAWNQIASPELKAYIHKESAKREKGLSNTAKNFFCLTETFPSEEILKQALEDYNLTSFSLGRAGKPKQVMLALALSMNLKDQNGNLDATRIPTFAIAASVSTINWHGNGCKALSMANSSEMRTHFRKSWNDGIAYLKTTAKQWVCGKSRTHGVNELSQLNMITPQLIKQYQKLELAGADKLAQEYQQAILKEEAKTLVQYNLATLFTNNKKQR